VSLLKKLPKQEFAKMKSALTFDTLAKCSTTKARVSILTLPHGPVDTPVFMPVGTQGTMKGMLPDQLEDLNCQIMLNNTYHLVRYIILQYSEFVFRDIKSKIIGLKTWKRNIRPYWRSSQVSKLGA
jgi:hypothetical protein